MVTMEVTSNAQEVHSGVAGDLDCWPQGTSIPAVGWTRTRTCISAGLYGELDETPVVEKPDHSRWPFPRGWAEGSGFPARGDQGEVCLAPRPRSLTVHKNPERKSSIKKLLGKSPLCQRRQRCPHPNSHQGCVPWDQLQAQLLPGPNPSPQPRRTAVMGHPAR